MNHFKGVLMKKIKGTIGLVAFLSLLFTQEPMIQKMSMHTYTFLVVNFTLLLVVLDRVLNSIKLLMLYLIIIISFLEKIT